MITELTEDQIAKFPDYVQKWTEVGLSTAPLDFEEAKKAAALCYESAGLPAPTTFFKFPSPMSALIGISMLQNGYEVPENVNLIEYVDGLNESDQKKIKDPSTFRDILFGMVYGSQDASWLSFYDFFFTEFPETFTSKLDGLKKMAEVCGWWSPYKTAAVFQDRPEVIKLDEEGLLHCEDGPAILYRDGYAVYAWRGIRIPGEWIENPESLTAEIALTWENVEQRRCACELLGWNNVLIALNARVIDTNPNPMIGTLLEVDIPEIGDNERFLRVECGTGREFALPVPPETKTALEAQAWLNFCTEEEILDLEFRT